VELDFESGGGVLFVHTRDGRYAGIEYYADAFSSYPHRTFGAT
jgi:hypothetical protein